jgi:diguanylate cyclase (GGDEF)-like protein
VTGLIATDITDRKRLETALQKLADTDALTGCYNRRRLRELAALELRRAERYDVPLSLALLDVDEFKRVNDVYGHEVGDRVLAGVAHECQAELRGSDVLGRVGGDEFVLVMPHTTLDGAAALLERVRQRVEAWRLRAPDERILGVTVTAGVASAAGAGEDLDEVLRRADTALYRGKHAGRNRVAAESPAP